MSNFTHNPTLLLLLLLLLLPTNSHQITPKTAPPIPPRHLLLSPHHPPAPAPGPTPIPSTNHHHKHKLIRFAIGFLVGSISGILSGLLVSLLFHLALNYLRGRYHNRLAPEIFTPIIKSKSDLAFLQSDNVLSDLQIIGRGGSGEVYLKELPTAAGPILLAIKRIRKSESATESATHEQHSRLLDKWMRQIRSEIKTVGRIRHRNLLPLLAHVPRPDCHYLIYEYMNNGSLHNVLTEYNDNMGLNWDARLRVAMGIAAGLEHLHLHNKPHIIHRDLKPANILLDSNMEARIADFGFAKEISDSDTHMTMSNIAGTVGYIAPEYYQTMKYTTKCDIYSFGVILGVMVVGRFPSDEFFVETDEMGLVKWMRNRVRVGDAAACFDRRIAGGSPEREMELALKIACFCTAEDPKERPSSKEIRVMLAQIGKSGN